MSTSKYTGKFVYHQFCFLKVLEYLLQSTVAKLLIIRLVGPSFAPGCQFNYMLSILSVLTGITCNGWNKYLECYLSEDNL